MNPGLGIKKLHEQGITGEGINVAIIDQKLLLDHPEYADCIEEYYETEDNKEYPYGTMHGPAVTSLLAGKNIGTAPGADIYFAAGFTGNFDATGPAECLKWIVEQNRLLPEDDKIRIVSVSAAPEEGWFENAELYTEMVETAQEEGILIIDCRENYETGFVASSFII